MKVEVKDRIYTVFTIIIVMLVIAAALVKAGPLYRKYVMLKEQDAERDAKIHAVELKTAELNESINTFGTSDESVESAARAEHRYPPNETVFIFERSGGAR